MKAYERDFLWAGMSLLQPVNVPKDMKGIDRDTCAPRYIQSMDMPQIPYVDSAPPSQTS